MARATESSFAILPFSGLTEDIRRTHQTFLCADVVRFTTMTQQLGDLGSIRLMRRVARVVQAEVGRCAGRIIELRGDSFLAALDNPDDAVRCAGRLHERLRSDSEQNEDGGVGVRIALHAGPVLQVKDHFFGLNVILPYRLLTQLEAGQTGISEEALQACTDAPPTRVRSCHPKGFRDVVSFGVVGPPAEASGAASVESQTREPARAPDRRKAWRSAAADGDVAPNADAC